MPTAAECVLSIVAGGSAGQSTKKHPNRGFVWWAYPLAIHANSQFLLSPNSRLSSFFFHAASICSISGVRIHDFENRSLKISKTQPLEFDIASVTRSLVFTKTSPQTLVTLR